MTNLTPAGSATALPAILWHSFRQCAQNRGLIFGNKPNCGECGFGVYLNWNSTTGGSANYSYTYDAAGNILSANKASTNHTYTYGDSNWRDLLTAYDGQTISYDNAGNPTSYYNGTRWTFTWGNGRRLETATNGTVNASYNYMADGTRTSKVVDGVTHTYYYSGGKLLRETYGSTVLDFFYDANGTPIAMKQNGAVYYYITNLQGDVVHLVNSAGSTAAYYKYDPYGNATTASGSHATINPLRYRGYYYDTETGLYYVSSRYYDPEIGRFINADSLVSTGQGILGNNMFAYCLNNPVNYIDRDGTNAEALQWWTTGMGWLPFADTALPIGDIIYVGGILLLGAIALASDQDYVPEISYDEADVAYGPPSPNNDDDDDDYDDYYDDESNFGGRQKVGKKKGSAPGNNQAQNKQFRDATKGLTPDQQRIVHDKITGKGLGYHEIKAVIKDLFVFVIGLFAFEE